MAYNRSDDDFSGPNDILISDDIIDQFGGSTDPIDLEDVQEDAGTQTTIGSNTKRKATKEKAKCWQHFELMPTGKVVDGIPELKAQCKHCHKKLALPKGTTHLNRHFKKCQYRHEGLDTNQAQLQFRSPGAESSTHTLNNWIYSQELIHHDGLPKLIVNVEFPLRLVDKPYRTKFIQKYLQPRSRLKADILESLLCLKDWDDAELRIQDKVDRIIFE
ncbi:BED-type domain-containing protein [Abeliophyllum distichum]|uniref:BED-type domain-containing protein n=1 Tax=Abeliophyllum distichum TaxID=126358 RepID=A0ABD1QTK5_9LAMI